MEYLLKRIVMLLMAAVCVLAASAQSNSMKVVVSDDGMLVGRYVRQTDTTYVANPLDWEVVVSKEGYRVEVWTPEKGKGFVVRRDEVRGNINVRRGPSTKTPIVSTITEADGRKDYPDNTFDCLGMSNGLYKIKIKGKVGYVRQDLVEWAAYYAD